MTNIAFLGLGAMGSRMARRLIEGGQTLTVWNRSAAAAEPFAALGATIAATPREAAAGAEVVISMLVDDAAARAVWLDPANGAALALGAGKLAIESSTVTPGWIGELGAHVRGLGADFVEGPVAGSRPQAEAGKLIFILGGEPGSIERARPILANAGSAFPHVGAIGAGARVKLAVNSMLATQVALWAELAGALTKAGFDEAALVETLAGFPVMSPAAVNYARMMATGVTEPQFTVELMAKDLRYAEGLGANMPVVSTVRAIFEAGINADLGGLNLSALRSLYS